MIGLKWNSFCQWLLNLIILNILWIVSIMLGVGVITFGPANYAMAATIRKWQRDQQASKPITTYWRFLKEAFPKEVISGMMIILVMIILIVDFLYIKNWYLRIPFVLASLLAIPMVVTYYAVVSHIDTNNVLGKIKFTLQLFIRNSLIYCLMIGLIVVYTLIMVRWFPAYFILIGASSIQYIITLFIKRIFIKENFWNLEVGRE